MHIELATTDDQIIACYPVMRELRPHIDPEEFPVRIRAQQATGYHLVAVTEGTKPVAVAGFRLGANLAWGRFLYVDDLVVLPERRSAGFGKALLDWLRQYAAELGCAQLHLDSGMQRVDAHRFYLREGMEKASYHFAISIEPQQ